MDKTNQIGMLNRKLYLIAFLAVLFSFCFFVRPARADQLDLSFSSTDGSDCANISDGSYFTTEYFDPGTEITLTSAEGISSLYMVWENVPGSWTLRVNGQDYHFGADGYLHEYVELPAAAKGATEVTIVVGDSRITIADVYAFSDGSLPDFVQQWSPSYEEADILLLSTHADDEALFFGGIIPNYTDKDDVRVQVAYFTDLFQTEPARNHEILNGLWTMGVDHYPNLGEFYDHYSETLAEAQEQYDHDASLEYVVRLIRNYKPQVVIAQDIINGEYGHGGHIWSATMVAEAIEISADASQYSDSAQKYGTWEPLKTYMHLYPENQIELNARVPLSSFGGKTALEVAKLAYLEHQSQQWCWFYVSDGYDEDGNPDGYEYSCTIYGLYKTLVGVDTLGNDILENITTYDQQEKLAAQEAEALALAAAAEETAEEEPQSAQSVVDSGTQTAVPGGRNTTTLVVLIILAVIVAVIIVAILVISRIKEQQRKQQQKLDRMRRAARSRAEGSKNGAYGRSRSAQTGNSRARSTQGSRNTQNGAQRRDANRSSTASRSAQGMRSSYQGRVSRSNPNVRRGESSDSRRRSSYGSASRIFNDED